MKDLLKIISGELLWVRCDWETGGQGGQGDKIILSPPLLLFPYGTFILRISAAVLFLPNV